MKARVIIDLYIPKNFKPVEPWSKEQCLDDYIHHWLKEGYFIHDYIVDLPDGIEFKNYKIDYPKEWKNEPSRQEPDSY